LDSWEREAGRSPEIKLPSRFLISSSKNSQKYNEMGMKGHRRDPQKA